MKQTVTKSMFNDAVQRMRPDNFSYEGRQALFEYLTNLEADTGEEIELDVIALCCDFSEISVADIESETSCESLEDLRDKTTVINVDAETVIYQSF